MKRMVLAAVIVLLAGGTASATCKSDAADKKLAGAALNSFLKKCESDAKTKCDADSAAAEARRRRQEQPHEEVRDGRGRAIA